MAGLLQIDLLTDHSCIKENGAKYNAVTQLLNSTLKSLDIETEKHAAPRSAEKKAVALALTEKVHGLQADTFSLQATNAVVTEKKAVGIQSEKKALVKDTFNTLSGSKSDGLKRPVQTLNQMAESCKPILKSFDDILTQPYLENHNALFNTAPIVGLSGRNIKYMNIKSVSGAAGKSNLLEEWDLFDQIPKEANLSNGSVHMFPYNGQFYLTVGKSMWRKTARPQSDDQRKEARNSWPKLFEQGWKPIGDDCLPATNLRAITAWAEGIAPKQPMRFHLFAVDKDGVLKVCSDSDLTDKNTFETITFTKNELQKNCPKWKYATYHAQKLFAIDEENNSWNLTVAKGAKSFSIGDKVPQQPIQGLTANDTGIIAARPDGFLWRRIVDASISAPGEAAKPAGWTKWKECNGITNIGVASPGVFLDLRTLTSALRDQYLQTQVAIWPVVNKIKAFATIHHTYLGLMKETSQKYSEADDDNERMKIKNKASKQTYRHITRWAKKLYQASQNSQYAVADMTAGLKGVSQDLRAQAEAIKSKITGLKKVLEGQKEELKSIKDVQFWSLVVLLVAFVVIMVAMCFGLGWLAIGAGVVFLVAFVVEKVYESKEDTARHNIAQTESQIASLETSLNQLEALATYFEAIEGKYTELNMFWGRMAGVSSNLLKEYDPDIEEMFNDELEELWEDVTLITAMNTTKQLEDGALAYLDLINSQGIYIPTEDTESWATNSIVTSSVVKETLVSIQTETAPLTASLVAEKIVDMDTIPKVVEVELVDGKLPEMFSESVITSNCILDAQAPADSDHKTIGIAHTESLISTPELTNVVTSITLMVPSEVKLLTEAAYNKTVQVAQSYLEKGDFETYMKKLDSAAQIMQAPEVHKHNTIARSGEWFDIEAVRNNVSMFYDSGLTQLLDHAPGDQQQIKLHLRNTQVCVGKVASDAISLAQVMNEWSTKLKAAKTDEKRKEVSELFAQPALVACTFGQVSVRNLNNAFTEVNHDVNSAHQQVEIEIKKLQEQVNPIDSKLWDDLMDIQNQIPFPIQLFGRSLEWAEAKAKVLQSQHDSAVRDYEMKIFALRSLANSGFSFKEQSLNWKQFVERISTFLGQTYLSLLTIRDEIEGDPDMFADNILNVQWPSLIDNAWTVLQILGSQFFPAAQKKQTLFMNQLPSSLLEAKVLLLESSEEVVKFEAAKEEPALFPSEEEEDENTREVRLLSEAIQALPLLPPVLQDSVEEEEKFFKRMTQIQSQPHANLIKAYDINDASISLTEFCGSIVNSYALAAHKRNRALNSLKAFSLIQGSNLRRLQKGRKKWSAFADEYKLRMTNAIYYAEKASDNIEANHKNFRELLKAIQTNKTAFAAKVGELDRLIAADRKKISDHNFQVAADGATLLVIGVAAGLAVFQGPAIAFKAVQGAQSIAGPATGGQYKISNTFKTFYSKMNWEQFKESLSSWGTLRQSLEVAGKNFKDINETLKEMEESGKALLKHLREMQSRIVEYSERIKALEWDEEDFKEVAGRLGEEQMTVLVKGWEELVDGCDLCMDSFNGHGFYIPEL